LVRVQPRAHGLSSTPIPIAVAPVSAVAASWETPTREAAKSASVIAAITTAVATVTVAVSAAPIAIPAFALFGLFAKSAEELHPTGKVLCRIGLVAISAALPFPFAIELLCRCRRGRRIGAKNRSERLSHGRRVGVFQRDDSRRVTAIELLLIELLDKLFDFLK
jgi:hypothetical protein